MATESNAVWRKLRIAIFVVLVLVLAILLAKRWLPVSKSQKALLEIAHQLNRTCPVMLDQDTRLDSASVLPDKTLRYHYTMVRIDRDSILIPELKASLETQLLEAIRTNPQLKPYKDGRITLIYQYHDKMGRLVTSVVLDPRKYLRP